MTDNNSRSPQAPRGINHAPIPYLWEDVNNAERHVDTDRFLEGFKGLPSLIPPEAVFTQTDTRDGFFFGYVFGDLPAADSWFTFPQHFLGNKSIPVDFFAAGWCVGPLGNSSWLTVAIRKSNRALWVRVATGNIFGENEMDEAQAILSDATKRWQSGEKVVVAGIHAQRLPTPLPSPLFADRIVDDKPESWPTLRY